MRLALLRSTCRPENFAPLSSLATMPNRASAKSSWCCSPRSAVRLVAAALRAVADVIRTCSDCGASSSTSVGERGGSSHSAIPRMASLENAVGRRRRWRTGSSPPTTQFHRGKATSACSRSKDSAWGTALPRPRLPANPPLRAHHPARLARSRRPHRLLQAPELFGAGRSHRPQS